MSGPALARVEKLICSLDCPDWPALERINGLVKEFCSGKGPVVRDDHEWLYEAHFKVGLMFKNDVILLFPKVVWGNGGRKFECKIRAFVNVNGTMTARDIMGLLRRIASAYERERGKLHTLGRSEPLEASKEIKTTTV